MAKDYKYFGKNLLNQQEEHGIKIQKRFHYLELQDQLVLKESLVPKELRVVRGHKV